MRFLEQKSVQVHLELGSVMGSPISSRDPSTSYSLALTSGQHSEDAGIELDSIWNVNKGRLLLSKPCGRSMSLEHSLFSLENSPVDESVQGYLGRNVEG